MKFHKQSSLFRFIFCGRFYFTGGKVSVADLVELEARVNALSSRFESLQDRVRQEKSQLDTLNVRFRSKPNFRPNHVLTQRFGICARVQALTKQLQEQHREAVLLQMQKQ